jgi:hypothetical protein
VDPLRYLLQRRAVINIDWPSRTVLGVSFQRDVQLAKWRRMQFSAAQRGAGAGVDPSRLLQRKLCYLRLYLTMSGRAGLGV